MRKKITPEIKKLIWALYDRGLPVSEIAREAELKKNVVFKYVQARINGFDTPGELNNFRARQRGYSSYYEMQREALRSRGFASYKDYIRHLVKLKYGSDSVSEYAANLASKRQDRPENRLVTRLITQKLAELKENRSWLARQMGVSRQSASLYASGKAIPEGENLRKLLAILEVPYKTLDDLMQSKD